MQLTNQKILIISPERWGINMLSKHHYAVALAKRNNTVFFLNPPSRGGYRLNKENPNLNIIDVSPYVPGLNRIVRAFPFLENLILRLDIKKVLQKIPQPDIVWSFDPYRFQNLKLFGAKLAIYHPVDFFTTSLDLSCAKSADIVFSVAEPILRRYRKINPLAFFVNHGVSDDYLKTIGKKEESVDKIRCGYVGNLLSRYIDHENLVRIIKTNPSVEFNFIGPYKKNNLGSEHDPENAIHQLSNLSNVIFHGELPPRKVAEAIRYYDLFLISYDAERAGDAVSNSHKILEYLSTGKVVVSSHISTYDTIGDRLFEMVLFNKELAGRFNSVVSNLEFHNSTELQRRRISFARQNSYAEHLQTIERIVNEVVISLNRIE